MINNKEGEIIKIAGDADIGFRYSKFILGRLYINNIKIYGGSDGKIYYGNTYSSIIYNNRSLSSKSNLIETIK